MSCDTPELAAIAEANTVLRVQVGSRVQGVTVPSSDEDELGVVIEPAEYVIGLARVIDNDGFSRDFKQYESRTQARGAASGAGDRDYTAYSLRKFARLAAHGDPSCLLALFAPEDAVFDVKWPGHDLRNRRTMFLSRQAGWTFLNCVERELRRMEHVPAAEPKSVYRALHLAYQGRELLETGRITLPVTEPFRSVLYESRVGGPDARRALGGLVDSLRDVVQGQSSPLPPRADYPQINEWLTEAYLAWWGQ